MGKESYHPAILFGRFLRRANKAAKKKRGISLVVAVLCDLGGKHSLRKMISLIASATAYSYAMLLLCCTDNDHNHTHIQEFHVGDWTVVSF